MELEKAHGLGLSEQGRVVGGEVGVEGGPCWPSLRNKDLILRETEIY